MKNMFDVIVVGGGHAGIEAAYAAAKMGSKTLLITLNLDRIGYMPCNPAIGGIGKGHIVFEISAFGGLMPQLCSQTYLQARMLNTRKGPAVQGLRLQIDKNAYSELSQQILLKTKNLTVKDGMVTRLLTNNGAVTGVATNDGHEYAAPAVVITTGTFLKGLIHIGTASYPAGRQGEAAATELSTFLYEELALKMGRLKTGTPPRLLRSSIDFSVMEYQGSDDLDCLFEFYPHKVNHKMPCFITHTNENTHNIIRENAHLSPIYSGHITGIAPRYCPSIEDKISRFPDKTSHHVFVEPESATSDEVYPNGLSTSLPLEVQEKYIRSIKGFENATIVRPGYAIEYDFVLPNQLKHTLELYAVPGLFLAGQINGTTGYEEAAGQGLVAGINAHQKAKSGDPFIFDRNESYIGVMVDDLVTLGVDEPYRMFTSRAERRLLLRQDNVFKRLSKKAWELGLIDKQTAQDIHDENILVEETLATMKKEKKESEFLALFKDASNEQVKEKFHTLVGKKLTDRTLNSIHAELLYGPYLGREQKEIERSKTYAQLAIPEHYDYTGLPGLSKELQQKLSKIRPKTISQATLIPGMTPAAISLLIFKIREKKKETTSCAG